MLVKNGKITYEKATEYLIDALKNNKEYCSIYKCMYEDFYGKTICKELAEKWVKSMAITDGSDRENGQKWTIEQTSEVGNKIGIDWNKITKIDWYSAMNMVYSDFYGVAKYAEKQSDVTFFAKMAKSWLNDEDVGENKLYNYYFKVICA